MSYLTRVRWFVFAFSVTGILFYSPSDAQQVKYGIRVGLNMTKLFSVEQPAMCGYHVGGFARFSVSRYFAFQPEVIFSTKGLRATAFNAGDANYRFCYLDVPLLMSASIASVVNVYFGGYVNYLLTASSLGGTNNSAMILEKGDFTSLDFGLVSGLELNIGHCQLGARYNFGFAPVAQSNRAIGLLGRSHWANAQLYAAFIF